MQRRVFTRESTGAARTLASTTIHTAAVGALALLAGLTIAPNARAYRPFDGTDAEVAGVGEFELELGPVHWLSQGDSHYAIAPATVLNLGILPGWELVADFDRVVGIDDIPRGQARDRLVDLDVFTKVLLFPGSLQHAGRGPSIAIEAGPLLPGVNGESGFGASCNVIASERWDSLALHVNSRLELDRSSLQGDWFESVIVEGNVRAQVRPVSEWFVEYELITGTMTISGLVGGIWRAQNGLDLDVGLREARIGSDRATEVRIGLTWTVPAWREDRKASTKPGQAM